MNNFQAFIPNGTEPLENYFQKKWLILYKRDFLRYGLGIKFNCKLITIGSFQLLHSSKVLRES